MKHEVDDLQLSFDDIPQEPVTPAKLVKMFAISPDDLQPILDVSHRLNPGADYTRIGDWGILFFVCGARAGESPSWKATVFENLRVPSPSEYVRLLAGGTPDPEDFGLLFHDVLEEWTLDETSRIMAHNRLQATQKFTPQQLEIYPVYFGLAIMLNSLSDLDIDKYKQVKEWANGEPSRWQTLFFAAGLLASGNDKIRWEHMASTILSTSQAYKPDVQALFARYSSRR